MEDLRERMREGVRGWVRFAAHHGQLGVDGTRLFAHKVRDAAPIALLAGFSAGAFVPLLQASTGAVSELVGGLGTNVLSDMIVRGADTLRARNGGAVPDALQTQRELSALLEEALSAGDEHAESLRAEIATVLREIDASGTALREAVRIEGRQLGSQIAAVFVELRDTFGEFAFLLGGLEQSIVEIQRGLRNQELEHRADRAEIRRQTADLGHIRAELAVIRRQTAPDSSGPASDLPGADVCPYRGLLPFGVEHAEVFYGREQTTFDLVAMLGERLGGVGMLLVSGASGVGKSSLLRAGLLPALADGALGLPGSEQWPRVVMTPTSAPLGELAVHLAGLLGTDAVSLRRALVDAPDQAHVLFRQAAQAHADDADDAPRLVLVVDQFEEVFTLAADRADRKDTAEAFVTLLRAVAETPCGPKGQPAALVVIGVRGDFWDRCAALPDLIDVMRDGVFILSPLLEFELRRAISGPAERAGLTLADGLIDTILSDLRSNDTIAWDRPTGLGVLPLVSQAMLTTWEWREGRRLTIRGYGKGGGVALAVQSSAEEAYAKLTDRQRETAREVFHHLTTVSADGQPSGRRVPREELQGEDHMEDVLSAFAERRIVVLRESTVEVAHDILFLAWPRLREWLHDDQNDRVVYSRLVTDAEAWAKGDRDPSFLYRGARLVAVEQARPRWERYPPLSAGATEFLSAARRAGNRSARWRGLVAGALVVLAIAAVGTALVARSDSRDALSRELATKAEVVRSADITVARLLATAAWDISPTDEARRSMLSTLLTPDGGTIGGGSPSFTAATQSSDGKIIALADAPDHSIQLYDAITRKPLGSPLKGHAGLVTGLVFNHAGDLLASSSYDGTLRLWRLSGAQATFFGSVGKRNPPDISGYDEKIAFSRDGKIMAVGDSRQGAVWLWDIRKGRALGDPIWSGKPVDICDLDFSPDGKTLAVGERQAEALYVRLWDVTARRYIGAPIAKHNGPGCPQAFSPDGRTIAIGLGDGDGGIRLVDVDTRKQIREVKTDNSMGLNDLVFTPDGTGVIATGSQSTGLWSVPDLRPISEPLSAAGALSLGPDGHTLLLSAYSGLRILNLNIAREVAPQTPAEDEVIDLAFSPDGRTLATQGADDMVRFWDTQKRETLGRPLKVAANNPMKSECYEDGMAFSSEGDLLATTDGRGATIWEVETRRRVMSPFKEHQGSVDGVDFSPDGAMLAVGNDDNSVRLWDVASGRRVGKRLIGHTDGITKVVYGPNDGAVLATGSDDGTARLWDAASRQEVVPPLTGHNESVTELAFSPDGAILATASLADRTIRLWDTSTGDQIGDPLTGHTEGVCEVAFSPNGRTLASTGLDGTTRLWDVDTRSAVGDPFTGHTGGVYAVAFNPDGTTMVTGGNDKTIKWWGVALPEDPFTSACLFAGRSLTPEEWRQYIPGETYRDICPQ
ncbi:hypothetical protein Acor_82850 [Acrocarpospora corrugata]|uniref:Novel STAND NTPase 1 domain-containing protein n=1 Tax=Acrocarpospora corrugata TaxID=35763 RepID=A0A5M3WBL7_9ACTN|nr:AAA family ATPase [Acrocarpospora corrugata]GES06216.1 hypothetical protein Acor_82850 [Acrocarpospora corrugata]